MTIYGLPNCDTTKAALKWLKAQQLPHHFYDVKARVVTAQQLERWLQEIPVERLLNKKSTTWRNLSPGEQERANTRDGAIELMAANTSLVKRPLIAWDNGKITVGYDPEMFTQMLESA